MFVDDAEMSPMLFPVLTLPKRLSIFSLGEAVGSSSSLKRMSTSRVSKSTDALSSLDSPSVSIGVPSTPATLTRSRAGVAGIRSSFFNLIRPTFGNRRPSCPVVDCRSTVQPAAPCPGSKTLTLTRARLPSDGSCDLHRSAAAAATDEDEEDSVASSTGSASAWSGRARSVDDRLETAAPPALPRRPPHLLETASTPTCSDRPLPLLPPITVQQPSPVRTSTVRTVFNCYVVDLVTVNSD